jgi:hypothetical protein
MVEALRHPYDLWDVLNGRIIVAHDKQKNLLVTWNQSDTFQVFYVDRGFEDVTFRECQIATGFDVPRNDLEAAIHVAETLLAES